MPHATREICFSRRLTWGCTIPGVLLLTSAFMLAPAGASAGDPATGVLARNGASRAAAEIELGRRLFFDPAASPSGKRSCASCHDPDHGFSDPKRLSADDFGITTRHSQTIIDGANNPSAHWDGEFATVADLVRKRIGSSRSPWAVPVSAPELPELQTEPNEVPPEGETSPLSGEIASKDGARPQIGLTDELVSFLRSRHQGPQGGTSEDDGVATSLQDAGHYAEAFKAAYGSDDVTIDAISRAVAAFCKTVKSTEAPIDRFLAGDEGALAPAARRGLDLFRGRAGCVACHTMTGDRPAFTDYGFRNTGVAWSGVRRRHPSEQIERLGMALEDPRLMKRPYIGGEPLLREWIKARGGPVEVLADRGRGGRAGLGRLDRSFKTPTLRDAAKRAPYMHDGSLKSLEAVVRYYAKGCCAEDPGQDPRLRGFAATESDVADLVAFLRTLSGDQRPGLARGMWSKRVRRTRVRVTRGGGRRLVNAQVVLTEEGDVLPVRKDAPAVKRLMKTDGSGCIEFAPGRRTHVRIRLVGDDDPQGGLLVPDSCRAATARMRVAGRITIVVWFPAHIPVVEMLRFRHRGQATDGLTTQLRLAASEGLDEGGRKVTYQGWVRSSLPKLAQLVMPGLTDPLRGGERTQISIVLGAGETVNLKLKTYGWQGK